jgi:PAS domain S-box-containing protein
MNKKEKSREELIKELHDLQQLYKSLKVSAEKEISLARKSAEKFRKAYMTSPDAININRLSDGNYISVNEVFTSIIGYTEEEIVGKSSLELNIWVDPVARANMVKEIKSKGEVRNFEAEFLAKDGSIINGSMSASIIDIDGVPHILSVTRDISRRKQVEDALRESEERFSKAYKTSPISFMIAQMEDGKIIEVNDAFTTISGFTREETLGSTTLSKNMWVHEEDRQNMINTLRTGRPLIRQETQLRGKYGNVATTLLSAQAIKLGNGYCIISSIEDITERKQAEEELIKSKKKAEESDKLKTAFLHNISHEIRTPMNAIIGFAALLAEPNTDEKTRCSYIETIMQSSNHLLAVISDIVDISNIEANLVKHIKNPIDVNSAVRSLWNQFLPKAAEKNILMELVSEISDPDALVLADRTKLTQVLANLINNALKFTEAGSIKVICRKEEEFLEFSVSDTGIGIAVEDHRKVFDRFYQAQNNTSRMFEGTGLGLAISKAYVELMGGRIWLSSKPGKGTVFYFTIPYERQIITSKPVIEKTANDSFVFSKMKTILIAEDIDSNFKLISNFLSGANTKIFRATNGKEALEIALARKDIDLILMDIKMPEMDGYTAVRLIRDANIKVPIVAQTAYADDMDKAINIGCDGFISKPFDKKTLFKVISKYI